MEPRLDSNALQNRGKQNVHNYSMESTGMIRMWDLQEGKWAIQEMRESQ